MRIIEASPQHLQTVVSLFREYQANLGIDLCFQNFEQELASLPGKYSRPAGAIFLAEAQVACVGCVAIRPWSNSEAELKRLYVQPSSRGQGVAWQLLTHAVGEAQSLGYDAVVLDTLPSMQAARSMYLKFGFTPVRPYYDNPIPGAEYYRFTCR